MPKISCEFQSEVENSSGSKSYIQSGLTVAFISGVGVELRSRGGGPGQGLSGAEGLSQAHGLPLSPSADG